MKQIVNDINGRMARLKRVRAMGLFSSCMLLILTLLFAACAGVSDNGTDADTIATTTSANNVAPTAPEGGASPAGGGVAEGDPAAGQQVAQQLGCAGCHSPDGAQAVGPTWQGLYGAELPLASGETVTGDDAYITNSILNPNDQVHEGYPSNVMPSYAGRISDQQIADIIAYMKTLSE